LYGIGKHDVSNIKQRERTPMRLLQSLTRGLRALNFLRAQDAPVRLTDVASELGVEKSNASHVLKTLVAAGYAAQNDARRYLLTEHGVPTGQVGHTLEDIVACKEDWQSVLRELVNETGECAHMAVLVKTRVWYIDKIDSTLPLKVDHPIGALSPLHCTALGKAFLAFGQVEEVGKLTQFTAKTITTSEALETEINSTRRRGYAVDDEEFAPGIRCVARPIMDRRGRMIAALGVSGPSVRIDDTRLAELGALIKTASAQHQTGA
jgi:DNA-binding IclR family transcriptional regulator